MEPRLENGQQNTQMKSLEEDIMINKDIILVNGLRYMKNLIGKLLNIFIIHCYITFHGCYQNGYRYGNWKYFYYMTTLMGCGHFDENGIKQGKWIELFKNFWGFFNRVQYSSCQITEEGEYKNGKRIGFWNIIDQNKIISGGIYNEKGIKNGIWTELHDNFSCFCEISYQGQYKQGIKVGQWKTIYDERHIGGGSYDEKGMRNGIWTDMDENFDRNLQSTFYLYTQNYENGQKKGKMIKQQFERKL
ncbi:unnamed protein product [Paramecium primaurelia]|uniref:MORN repeat protein n=1 Tax=Paramecium primaurelia TaxID=5886 RepID=A0A8S1P4T2_PARPR|nr:unnamed protein product [Paramecium primaurelia]